jgi:hypothetical protein
MFLLGVAPLLVSQEEDRQLVEHAEPAHDRGIVGEAPVAVEAP